MSFIGISQDLICFFRYSIMASLSLIPSCENLTENELFLPTWSSRKKPEEQKIIKSDVNPEKLLGQHQFISA